MVTMGMTTFSEICEEVLLGSIPRVLRASLTPSLLLSVLLVTEITTEGTIAAAGDEDIMPDTISSVLTASLTSALLLSLPSGMEIAAEVTVVVTTVDEI